MRFESKNTGDGKLKENWKKCPLKDNSAYKYSRMR
jgi:hypothetical protein